MSAAEWLGSDEIEPPEGQVAEFPTRRRNLGAKSIAALGKNPEQDRAQAILKSKTIQYSIGAPGTVYHRELWVKRFRAYQKAHRIDETQMPTVKTMERFAIAITQNLDQVISSSIKDKPAPSLQTIQRGIHAINDYFVWKYKMPWQESFNRSAQRSVDNILDEAVKDARLTKGRWKDSQYVGILVLVDLLRIWFNHAHQHGTYSWDTVVYKALSLALLSALNCRAGDIALTYLYTGMEYLQWQDILVRFDGQGTKFNNIRAQFRLRAIKGEKDSSNDEYVYLEPFADPRFQIIDPLKLLLAHALRHGLIGGVNTACEVLEAMRQSPNDPLRWTKPEAPVLTALNSGRGLLLDKPAPAAQFNGIIGSICALGKITTNLSSHHIRHGAARDLARIDWSTQSGLPNTGVTLALHHSEQAARTGVTRRYIGTVEEPLNNKKAQYAKPNLFKHIGMEHAPAQLLSRASASSKRRRSGSSSLTTASLDASAVLPSLLPEGPFCSDIDPALSNGSEAAATAVGTQPGRPREAVFAALLDDDLDGDTLLHLASLETGPSPTTDNNSSAASPDRVEQDLWTNELDGDTLLQVSAIADTPDTSRSSTTSRVGGLDPVDIDSVDLSVDNYYRCSQVLFAHATDEASMGTLGYTEATISALADEFEQGDLDRVLGVAEPEPLQWAIKEDLPYIQYLAQINVVRIEQLARAAVHKPWDAIVDRYCARGNSRDEPTLYLFPCPNAVHGCLYENTQKRLMIEHASNCTVDEAHPPESLSFRCTYPDTEDPTRTCTKAFAKQKGLNSHIADLHLFEPKKCDLGCKTDRIFRSDSTWKRHVKQVHDTSFVKRVCPASPCSQATQMWISRYDLNMHLTRDHNWDRARRDAYFGGALENTGGSGLTWVPKGQKRHRK